MEFSSSDMSLVASMLLDEKVDLVRVERTNDYRYSFILQPLDLCLRLQQKYINDQLLVSAKAVADNIRMLKSQIIKKI